MKKIVIFTNDSCGLYAFRSEFISELRKNGNEIVAYTPFTTNVSELRSLGISLVETELSRRGMNPLKDYGLLKKYKSILKNEKPDFVITYTIKPNIYGGMACRFKKVPYAINITGLGTAFQNSGLLKKLVVKMYKIACKKAKIVFFENEENRQIFIENGIVTQNQTHCLHGAGVNLQRFPVQDYPKGKQVIFLFIGRIMREKGIDELFEAMRRLVEIGIDCRLDVLGGYEEAYEDIISGYEKEGWLHYYGYQNDVRPYIKNAHCFVLPSWHEGMANTNLECAASGRPVITSDIAGCREAVIDGKSGYLVGKQNVDDLFEKMKKFSTLSFEERCKMGMAGREHVEKVFDKEKVVAETIFYLKMK